jgi:hypothetical protein
MTFDWQQEYGREHVYEIVDGIDNEMGGKSRLFNG